ncbi:MAG: cupin domain-containing protein [Candidatus Pacebacteria bacterium]|nr:cupin domain-containing protein [Candidatus Paceibacterota bacterium]
MTGYTGNIEEEALENEAFRKVLYTSAYMQLVVMSIPAGDDIGEETHGQDQFIRVEEGEGKAVLDGVEHVLSDGYAVVIPASTLHNIINTSTSEPLKLYSLYAPPHHADGTIHATKAEAEADHEEYLGDVTEG